MQGLGYELNAIAAAVVGGCSLQGGVGLIPGTMLGVLFLRVVIDAVAKIVKVGADDYQGMIVGFLVVLAVAFNELRQAGRGAGKQFFPGALGVLAIGILAILSGTIATIMAGRNAGGVVSVVTLVVLGIDRAGAAPRCPAEWTGGRRRPATAYVHGAADLRFVHVAKQYPGVRALDDVSLEVRPGECLAIVGENGAGKSTLMKILSGVITDYEGEIRLRGRRVQFGGTRDAERAGRQHHPSGVEPGRRAVGRGEHLSGPRAAHRLGLARPTRHGPPRRRVVGTARMPDHAR